MASKVETIFKSELQQIYDKEIRNFVVDCFDKLCPDYFWTYPCSTSGKYHSKVLLGVGGLVRHVKLAVWWGFELIRAIGSSPGLKDIPTVRLQDETIAALLLHDMIKNGKGLGSNGRPLELGVTGTHGVILANRIKSHPDIYLDNDDTFYRILAGIAGHMGIWTTDPVYQPNNIENSTIRTFANLIHLADYCASRKVNNIYSELGESNGNNTTEIKEQETDPPTPDDEGFDSDTGIVQFPN